MISTQSPQKLVVTSALGRLLKERGINQKQFARIAGVSEKAISRIKNRKIVRRIDCPAAVKICVVLSKLPLMSDGTKRTVRLDTLFPITVA